MPDFLKQLNFTFLGEPFFRWVLFVIAMGIAMALWARVIGILARG